MPVTAEHKIATIVGRCKHGSCTIIFNEYMVHGFASVRDIVLDPIVEGQFDDVPADVLAEMIKRNTMITVLASPDGPEGEVVGVDHWSLHEALDKALVLLGYDLNDFGGIG